MVTTTDTRPEEASVDPTDPGGRALALSVTSLAAHGDQDGLRELLDPLDVYQLRALVTTMAASSGQSSGRLDGTAGVAVEAAASGPAAVCNLAVGAAASAFGTTPDAVLGADRHRTVTDARAVAMTAARDSGLTLTAIAAHFDKDHTSVLHAVRRTHGNPRLQVAAAQVAEGITRRYAAHPTESAPSGPPDDELTHAPASPGRSHLGHPEHPPTLRPSPAASVGMHR